MKKIILVCLLLASTYHYETNDSDDLIYSHNTLRNQEQLMMLMVNPKLMEAAQKHAEWMAEHHSMTHSGERGNSPSDRIKATGYRYQGCGENIAMGYDTVEKVMDGWWHSSGHRHNILGNYWEFGIGIARASDGTIYWCTDFGTPSFSN